MSSFNDSPDDGHDGCDIEILMSDMVLDRILLRT